VVTEHHHRAGSGEFRHAVLRHGAGFGELAVVVGVSVVDAEHCPLVFGGLEEFTARHALPGADGYGLRMLLFPDAAGARRRATLVTSAVEATRAAAAAWAAGGEYALPPFPPAGMLLEVLPGWPAAFVPAPAIETLFDVHDFFEPWSLDTGQY
jgi:hypothetical protein